MKKEKEKIQKMKEVFAQRLQNIRKICSMSQSELAEKMKELAEDGMTMVVVTHEMGFAREVATRVMFIDEGIIQEQNEPAEFFSNPQNPRLQSFLSKVL